MHAHTQTPKHMHTKSPEHRFVGGVKSIGYIMLLLFLVFYLFGIFGIIMFRDTFQTDPWHFQNLGVAMLSLFRAATLEDWTDLMYLSYYGCAHFPGPFLSEEQLTPTTWEVRDARTRALSCTDSHACAYTNSLSLSLTHTHTHTHTHTLAYTCP